MADPSRGPTIDGAAAPRARAGRFASADLIPRTGAAIVLGIAALGAAWAGGYWFSAFWLIAAIIVHWEWQNLIGGPNHELRVLFGSAGLLVAAPLATNDAVFWRSWPCWRPLWAPR